MKRQKPDRPPVPIRHDRLGLTRCRVCSCTELEPCNPPCAWVQGTPDLCTTCQVAVAALLDWNETAHRPSHAALLRELRTLLKQIDRGVKLAKRLGRGPRLVKQAGGKS